MATELLNVTKLEEERALVDARLASQEAMAGRGSLVAADASLVGASFRQGTTVGSIFGYSRANLDITDPQFKPLPEDFFDDLPHRYKPYASRFLGVSETEIEEVKRGIDEELRDRRVIESANRLAAIAAEGAVQVLDPVNYAPFAGVALKGGGLLSKLGRGAFNGFAGAAMQEPVLLATQQIRTYEESLANVGTSVLFGMALGAGVHVVEAGKAKWGTPARAGLKPSDEIKPLRDEVLRHIKASLEAVGYDADAAGVNADVVAQAFTSIASRSDADTKAIADAFKVKITAEKGEGAGLKQSSVDRGGRAVAAEKNADVGLSTVSLTRNNLDRGAAVDVARGMRGTFQTLDGSSALMTNEGVKKIFSGRVVPARAAMADRLPELIQNSAVYADKGDFAYGAAMVDFEGQSIALRLAFKLGS